jgi:hypothetical protein
MTPSSARYAASDSATLLACVLAVHAGSTAAGRQG